MRPLLFVRFPIFRRGIIFPFAASSCVCASFTPEASLFWIHRGKHGHSPVFPARSILSPPMLADKESA